jgi:UDP-N-acetylmuramyl pentapeptide phosphotransferase/UDP-N-acetylglucosamine-1-phosphate transferase
MEWMLMLEQAFKFTGKDLTKLSIMMIIATLLFGLPGLIMMLFLQWITYQSYALESIEKHGISQVGASRLGGATVCGFSIILFALGSYLGVMSADNFPAAPAVAWFTVVSCMLIGLLDDFKSNFLSPKVRLISTVLIFSLCLGFWPSLVPRGLGVPVLDVLVTAPVIGWAITVVFCIGFINAINMADGANGLMPGTITLACIVFYVETDLLAFAVLMTTCGLFTIFNVISGRLFLGDAGAYGLGSVLVISGLYLFSEKAFSASFLAVLFAYPCIDILVTVIRRRINGRSILLPDNDHLHNRVHFHCQRVFQSKTMANSMTGILIVSCSSGLALLGYKQAWWSATSGQWAWVFLAQCAMYLVTFIVTGFTRPPSQYVAGQ